MSQCTAAAPSQKRTGPELHGQGSQQITGDCSIAPTVRETESIHNAKSPHLDHTIVRILLLLLLLLLVLFWRLHFLYRSHTRRQ
jgi:hypothetical protein